MTDKTVNSLYQTLYLENRILKIQRNNEKTSEVYAAGRQCRQKNEEFFKEERKKTDRDRNAMRWKSGSHCRAITTG